MFPFRARSLKVTVYLSNCCVIYVCLLQAMCKFPISTPRGCSPTQFYHQPPGVSITHTSQVQGLSCRTALNPDIKVLGPPAFLADWLKFKGSLDPHRFDNSLEQLIELSNALFLQLQFDYNGYKS